MQNAREASLHDALVAQLAEHIHGKDKVNGSIPFEGWQIIEKQVFQLFARSFASQNFMGWDRELSFRLKYGWVLLRKTHGLESETKFSI